MIQRMISTTRCYRLGIHFGVTSCTGSLAGRLVGRQITGVETIATGRGVRDLSRLRKRCESSRWRKVKGVALVRIAPGEIRRAEVHWYEAHGIGRVRMKIKRFLD